MKFNTENEIINAANFQALKLTQLYRKDRNLFDQIMGYTSQILHVNRRGSLDMVYASKPLADYLDLSQNEIYKNGFRLIKQYLHPEFMKRSLVLVNQLDRSGDQTQICNIMQVIKSKGRWTFNLTQKLILDEDHYFSICQHVKGLGKPGMFIHDLLDEYILKNNGLKKFQSLTVREREILRLVSEGLNTDEIAYKLYISNHTVMTHRKTINKKLEVKSSSELFKYAIAFDMI